MEVTLRLLDRSNVPRSKPCGSGISLGVLERFPDLENLHAVSRSDRRSDRDARGGGRLLVAGDEMSAELRDSVPMQQ
jgi:hypothetical protein